MANLTDIPYVGDRIADRLIEIGYPDMESLAGQDPQELYDKVYMNRGEEDRCLLYVFRYAVYYVNTEAKDRDPQKCKWWNWKD